MRHSSKPPFRLEEVVSATQFVEMDIATKTEDAVGADAAATHS